MLHSRGTTSRGLETSQTEKGRVHLLRFQAQKVSALLPVPPTNTSQLGPATRWRGVTAAGLSLTSLLANKRCYSALFFPLLEFTAQLKRSPSEDPYTWTDVSAGEIKKIILFVWQVILACFFIYLLISALHFHSLFFLFHVFLLTLPDHFGSSTFLLDFHVKFHSLNTNTSNHGFLVVLILLEKQAGAAACSSGFQLPFALLEQDVGEEEKNQQQLKVLWSQQTTEVMLQ